MKTFLAALSIFFTNASLAYSGNFNYINDSVINMHAETDEMSEVVSQAVYGTPIKILERNSEWTQIETPDTYTGWCKTSQIFSKTKTYPSTPLIARVNAIWAHIYYVEDTTPHPPFMALPYGTKVEVLSSSDELQNQWMKVRLLDGRVFSAQCTDFVFNPAPHSIDEMIVEAKKFLGLPYRWGGNSGFGFDCSGFVQTLFSLMNIQLPRDAKLQAKANGIEINSDSLKRGDLIFFGRIKDRITHVGIYLGDYQFIHSVTTNKKGPHVIQISSLEDPEWLNLYITSHRIQ
jgi:cell wall-associated NlpC family hydrolase